MNDSSTLLIVVAFVLVFLFYEHAQQPPNALGTPPRPGGAGGSPHDANALAHAIGAASGVGLCVVGGAVAGAPQLGAQLAPICAAVGSYVAPAVKKAAVFVGNEAVKGAVLGFNTGKVVLSDPFASSLGVTSVAISGTAKASNVFNRGTDAVYNRLPVPAQLAVAPLYVTEKVTAKTVAVAAKVGGNVVGTLSSGAKAATNALSSGTHKVLSWL